MVCAKKAKKEKKYKLSVDTENQKKNIQKVNSLFLTRIF